MNGVKPFAMLYGESDLLAASWPDLAPRISDAGICECSSQTSVNATSCVAVSALSNRLSKQSVNAPERGSGDAKMWLE